MTKPRKRDIQHEREVLSSQIRLDGVGEDPAIKALKDMPGATNLEGLDIALALQEIIRGQKVQGEELAKLRQEMARMDENARKWEEDRTHFVEEIDRRADALRMSEEQREKLMAKEGGKMTELITKARASAATDQMKFDQWLEQQPKETVTSPGVNQIVHEGGAQVAKLIAEVIRIKHRVWVFPPFQPMEVPKPVADELRRRHRVQQETYERSNVLRPDSRGQYRETKEVEQAMAEIDSKYGTKTERLAS